MKIYKQCIQLTLFLSVFSFVFIIFFVEEIIRMWTNNSSVVPGFELIIPSLFFMIIGFWNNLNSIMLNGLSRFKGQATYGIFIAVLFAGIAVCLPEYWPKEAIVWIVSTGYLMRCLLMQRELLIALK